MDDPRYFTEAEAWDGAMIRVCGWCWLPQNDDPNDPTNHIQWCHDDAGKAQTDGVEILSEPAVTD